MRKLKAIMEIIRCIQVLEQGKVRFPQRNYLEKFPPHSLPDELLHRPASQPEMFCREHMQFLRIDRRQWFKIIAVPAHDTA